MLWHLTKQEKPHPIFVALTVLLFFLLLWQFLQPNHYFPMVLTLALALLLWRVIEFSKKKKTITNTEISFNADNSARLIEKAKEQERSRIYANLHDDVGAKLLQLIYAAKDETSKKLAKQVLKDIRHAVANTLNIQCNSKQLADEIVAEIKERLETCNIEVHSTLNLSHKSPNLAMQVPSVISRIFREVTSNIIKHAQASHVEITVQSTEKQLAFSVKDNGKGMALQNKNGKGLKTIQKRAKTINAMVNWHSQVNQGTQFSLTYNYEYK